MDQRVFPLNMDNFSTLTLWLSTIFNSYFDITRGGEWPVNGR